MLQNQPEAIGNCTLKIQLKNNKKIMFETLELEFVALGLLVLLNPIATMRQTGMKKYIYIVLHGQSTRSEFRIERGTNNLTKILDIQKKKIK